MDYKGVIIEESLEDKTILKNLSIISTRREKVTEKHQTSWLSHWTLDTIVIQENRMEEIATLLSNLLDYSHQSSWYVDFKNNLFHYLIFKKILKVDLKNPVLYKKAREYGKTLGIPLYQITFERLKR